MVKKGYHRGLRDPDLQLPSSFPTHVSEINGEKKILPIKNTLLTLSKLSKEKLEHIESYTDEGISYSSYMPVLHVPSEILERNPTGQEWIYGPIERLSFPVDIAIVMNIESSDDAIKKLKRKRKVTLSQIKEWVSGKQDVPEEVVEDLQGIDEGLQKFRVQKTPLIHMNALLGLGAPSLELLRRRKKILMDEMDTYGAKIANSPGDQKLMFQNFYPFAKSALFDRWTIQMEPGILAAGMPVGIRKLGDPFGFVLGNLVANDRPVYMNPERPTKELQRANTILICGDPGSGKTTTGKHIAHNLIEMDSIGFIEDPKGDYDLFAKHPTVKRKSRVVSFAPGEKDFEQVPLNIFRLAKERTQRNNAASTIINLLLNPKDDEYRGFVIGEALNKVYLGKKWDMFAFEKQIHEIAEKHDKEQYRMQADYCLGHLNNLRDNGIGSSLFVEDREEMIFDRNILISITRGLIVPNSRSTKDQWTMDERISAAIRYATSTLSFRHLMSLKRSQLKFQVFEEYWILKKFPGGRQLIEEALRFSRFENMLVILSTQNPTDSLEDETSDSDDINGLFSWKIMLRLESKEQIKAALTLLGMSEEDPEDWYTTFSVTYRNGKGIAKDPEGNIGELQINPIDEESMPYFKSTPQEEDAEMVQL
ncbi:ATP-binding protein [Paenibacillus sp. 1A_MP2]|uniref:ATP-binding protein n=1 Tax=Paenibacillus sp. 1A_MP2 TaxID=3457495 RepID=UPI003FCD6867